jgi:hypothetical protein
MRRFRTWLLPCALGFVTLAGGCSSALVQAAPAPHQSETPAAAGQTPYGHSLSDAARARCLAGGGFVRRAGMLGSEGCYHRFSDAGKTCHDGSDCLGRRCYYEGKDSPAASDLRGQCAADDIPFGCRQTLKAGRTEPAICVD